MPTIKCKRVLKAVEADLKSYMFDIDPAETVVIAGTPDEVKKFKIFVKPGYTNVIEAITSATGNVKTSNYPTEAQHNCTNFSVAAKEAVIQKSAGIDETVANAEGTWTVTFVLGLTLNGGNTVTNYNVVLTMESPFNEASVSI